MARLLDFGLVKPLSENVDTHLTREGSIAGSPLFMSPEQATGEDRVAGRSDIYSLVRVMYYMLIGQWNRFPFSEPFPAEAGHTGYSIFNSSTRKWSDAPPGIDPGTPRSR